MSEPNSPEKKSVEGEALKQMMRHKSTGALTDADDGDRILCYKKNLAPPPAIGYINQAKVAIITLI